MHGGLWLSVTSILRCLFGEAGRKKPKLFSKSTTVNHQSTYDDIAKRPPEMFIPHGCGHRRHVVFRISSTLIQGVSATVCLYCVAVNMIFLADFLRIQMFVRRHTALDYWHVLRPNRSNPLSIFADVLRAIFWINTWGGRGRCFKRSCFFFLLLP